MLGKFSGEEGDIADQTFRRSAEAVGCLIEEGVQMAQSRYNG